MKSRNYYTRGFRQNKKWWRSQVVDMFATASTTRTKKIFLKDVM